MVDIQSSNEKLIARGTRLIMEVTGVNDDTARQALDQAEGSAKVAIVMLAKSTDRAEAIALLEKHDGFLRRILQDI